MKPVDVKDNKYINSSNEVNDNDAKFKVDNHVRISRYKQFFAKGYTPNQSEQVFVIKKVKDAFNDLNGEDIIKTFYEKELQKNEQEFRIEKLIKKNIDKLYVK